MNILEVTEKVCRKCDRLKQMNEYSKDKIKFDGYRSVCKECENKRHKADREARGPEGEKERHLRNNYNITLEYYNNLRKEQNYSCAICKRHEDDMPRAMCVDHDHSCCPQSAKSCGECVRGLLCIDCNLGVGSFRDSLNLMLSAARYILRRRRKCYN